MDGHERDNVKKYRQEVFLPKMAEYEQAMVKWKLVGSELKHENPVLGPRERRILPIFQDESLFHANEYGQSIWCAHETLHPSQQISHASGKDSTPRDQTHEERPGAYHTCL
jgi:hypothetical protein